MIKPVLQSIATLIAKIIFQSITARCSKGACIAVYEGKKRLMLAWQNDAGPFLVVNSGWFSVVHIHDPIIIRRQHVQN